MRVLLRADASVTQGAGHVMRCLTLGEALVARGHRVDLMGNVDQISWLATQARVSGIGLHPCPPDVLDLDDVSALEPDRVVVDSYRIEADLISRVNREIPCLAIIDGHHRNIDAAVYLDHNLDAETRDWPSHVATRLLAGSEYALVRDAMLAHRRRPPRIGLAPLIILVLMGGTDPNGAIVAVARAIGEPRSTTRHVFVCPSQHVRELRSVTDGVGGASVVESTTDLPVLIGNADIVVSAAGTSAWDLCALGVPSVLVAVADNQRDGLRSALTRKLALGIDAVDDHDSMVELGPILDRLTDDLKLRTELSRACLRTFDGHGKKRVAIALETLR